MYKGQLGMMGRAALLAVVLHGLVASGANVCDKCNVAVANGGCKCDNSCNCIFNSPCDKCNLAVEYGGCKCDSSCNCVFKNACDKCNVDVAYGGCKCDSNCNCLSSGQPPASSGGLKIAAYWGQGDGSTQNEPSLASACSKYSIVFVSFLYKFGNGQDVSKGVDLAFHDIGGTGPDITTCQSKGVKIILSMGGGTNTYGFTSSADAKSTADQVWNVFLGGTASNRPFGSAIFDGVDMDVENVGSYYPDFVAQLTGHYKSAARKYYLTAVPQCIFPDANIGPALSADGSSFDFIGIHFYNNPSCSNGNLDNNYVSDWVPFAEKFSPSPKLIIGLPASPSAAGSGYQSPASAAAAIKAAAAKNPGITWGFFVWSVAYDFNNAANGVPYTGQVAALLSSSG